MNNRFKIFKLKIYYSILILLVSVLTVYFIISTFSQVNFKRDIIEKYKESYPVDQALFIKFYGIEDHEKLEIKGDLQLERNIYDFVKNESEPIDKIYYNVQKQFPIEKLGIWDIREKEKLYKGAMNFSIYSINEEYYEDYIKDYLEGDGFERSYFKSNIDKIPTILGSDFKGIYKLGEEITDNSSKKVYKIVGFLQKDRYIFSYTGTPAEGIQSLDKCIITPYNEEKLNNALFHEKIDPNEEGVTEESLSVFDLTKIVPAMMIKVKDKIDVEQSKSKLKNEASAKGMELDILTVREDIDTFLDKFNNELSFNVIILTIFSVLSIIIVSTIIKCMIERVKYNIGVLYSLGAVTKDIIWIILNKVTILLGTGFVLGIILYFKLKKVVYLFFANEVNYQYILGTLVIYIILILVSLVTPIIKLKRLKPIEILKEGRE